MTNRYAQRLQYFSNANTLPFLAQLQRGIEKEGLRVSNETGRLSQQLHPQALGSALTHPHITTDYSEALMELITPVYDSTEGALNMLRDVHSFVYKHLDDEHLWGASMPCILPDDEHIPIAHYGSSNIGQMKSVYREGLGHRYGRAMQTIAGIHYNFSLPPAVWADYQKFEQKNGDEKDFVTNQYFGLIRNFRRYSWLLLYLFGASPTVCKSFVQGRNHKLDEHDYGSLYFPHATSLRMGGLGYQSDAQTQLTVCYNTMDSYIATLQGALETSYPAYEDIGLKDQDGNFKQLNTALLQIENEFYSSIRPKRTVDSSVKPLQGLAEQGVEYIEVRCLDLNPYLDVGIDETTADFIDNFLVYCWLKDSPDSDCDEYQDIATNNSLTVNEGRNPELQLKHQGSTRSLRSWAKDLLTDMQPVTELLDQAKGDGRYQKSWQTQLDKVNDAALTPSAQILADMQAQDIPFFRLATNQAHDTADKFAKRELSPEQQAYFKQLAEQSWVNQKQIEDNDELDFDSFLADYFQNTVLA